MDLTSIRETRERLQTEMHKVIVGQDGVIDLMFTSLLSEGHILLEGVPGTGKTLLARCFAACLSLDFNRIQFTPDLMPGDVIGTNLFNFQTNEFVLTKGPIFTQLLLADEINRTPPKTQAALLQAMQERMVTIDGTTHELGSAYMVIATQNPIEQEGTYPLPEAQLDRFLFKVLIEYPSREEERALVVRHGHRSVTPALETFDLATIADLESLMGFRQVIERIRLANEIVDYVVAIVRATRKQPTLLFGASPRCATMLASGARAFAALEGRDYVIPDDVKALAMPTLRHRIVLAPGAEIEGSSAEGEIRKLLKEVPAPR